MKDRTELTQQSVAKGFMVLTISMMSVKVLSVLYTPFLRHILGAAGWGVYSSTYTIFTYIYTIANAGIPVAIAKLVAELEAKGNYKDALKTFKVSRTLLIVIGAVLSLFMFIFATPLNKAFNSTESILATRWLAPGILFTSIMCAYKGYFQGIGDMTPTAVSQVGEQILNIIFSLLFAAMLIGKGPSYGAAGGTVGTIVGAVGASLYFIWIYSKNSEKVRHRKNVEGVKRHSNEEILKLILRYAFPITIASALQNAGPIVDLKIVKGRLLSQGLSEVLVETQWGFIALYNTLISIPMAIMGALAIALVPAISRLSALKDKKALKVNIKSSYRVAFMISVPCAVGFAVLSVPILKILGYDMEVSPLLIWGSWVLVFYAISLIQTSILQGLGKVTLVTVFSVLGILVKGIVNYVLVGIPSIGIIGAVWGNGACYLVMMFLFQWQINKSIGVRTNLLTCAIKPVIAGLVMGIGTSLVFKLINGGLGFVLSGYILNLIAAGITIIIAGVIYVIVLISIGGVRKSDLNSLPGKLTKLIPPKVYSKLR